MRVPVTAPAGTTTAEVEIRYQGCAEDGICYPPQRKRLVEIPGMVPSLVSRGRMRFGVEGSEAFVCTGAMITRAPTEDFSPLFLTAAHCIETQAAANSMDIFWFFQTRPGVELR